MTSCLQIISVSIFGDVRKLQMKYYKAENSFTQLFCKMLTLYVGKDVKKFAVTVIKTVHNNRIIYSRIL